MTITQQAARAFHAAAIAATGKTMQSAIARLLGVTPQQYSDVLHGRSGSIELLHRWIRDFERDYAIVLVMRIEADGVECEIRD